MGSNLEARRAHLEKLVELAKRPEDRLRLKRTVDTGGEFPGHTIW